jgi:hypothetical protein
MEVELVEPTAEAAAGVLVDHRREGAEHATPVTHESCRRIRPHGGGMAARAPWARVSGARLTVRRRTGSIPADMEFGAGSDRGDRGSRAGKRPPAGPE